MNILYIIYDKYHKSLADYGQSHKE